MSHVAGAAHLRANRRFFFSGLSLKKKPFCQLSWRSQNRITLTFGRSALVYSAEEPCNVTNRCAFNDTRLLSVFSHVCVCVLYMLAHALYHIQKPLMTRCSFIDPFHAN
jgi:hypothetical protein